MEAEHRIDIERINKEVREFPPLHPECCIYRVHDGLRKVKPEAYEPMLVSIGPYHHQNPKLLTMRKHKLRYLHLLLVRRQEESVERYILELEKLEGRTRKCYADPIDQAFNSGEKFVEMMLLDGCFIIEILRMCSGEVLCDNDDPILNLDWMCDQIRCDMMLLENQLPYFVVSKLYDMTKNDSEQPFEDLVRCNFSTILPISPPTSRNSSGIDGQRVKHLLHLMHMISYPLSELALNANSNKPPEEMGSVVELQEAGVEFKMIDTSRVSNDVSLLDVKFDNGLMEIPLIEVDDFAETILRNLIAFEQNSLDMDLKLFSAFQRFMDQLISSENDVKLLRRRGIIKNVLGDDKVVSDIINKLGDGVNYDRQSVLYFSHVRQKVNIHCETPWNQMKAKLKHDYFNTPWAGVSTIAAIVLLILTFLQTFAALKSPSTWFK
ncbi:hypothetical protein L1049_019574 [Liquidambar formosana]|uniref:Uncharacterized protein n=1 Tax=Liquidambar formosana TaxID=63359 RepID=A0AAP0XA98_LIQFO